jgi:ribosomal protein S18 acetylase RimI-like enzyme
VRKELVEVIEVKRLKPGDEEEAGRIAERWYSGKGEVAEYRAFLSEKENYILAAYSEGELAGFLIGYELKRLETSQPMMLLYTIDVLPEYQRKGVGKKLVNDLKRLCTRRGALKMFVITNESNQPAMALYSSTGGKRESTDDVVFVYRADSLEESDTLCQEE